MYLEGGYPQYSDQNIFDVGKLQHFVDEITELTSLPWMRLTFYHDFHSGEEFFGV